MKEASAWLKQRRRWRATTLGWSIHKENKKLDRAGEAKKSTFDFLSMDALIELVHFSLLQDNVVLAAGEPWRRSGAIPMGGPFSAQSADLHCVWCCKKFVHLLRRMGAISVTPDGILQWALPDGNTVALQQFRDNVMVAAKGPAPHLAMYPVCQALEQAWNLHVLCPCRDKNPSAVCRGSCMGTSVRCMGVTVYVSTDAVFCHSHPNALDAHGQLKFGAPLQSFWATNTRRTTNVFLSALSNTLPFLQSWGAFLLSCVLWMQLAVLSGYPTHAVRTSMQSAVHRLLAKTPWDVTATVQWILFIVRRLPQSLSDSLLDLVQWLQREATCRGAFYASWHLRHHGPCSDFCGDWSADLPLILSVSRMLSTSPQVDWGVHRGRGSSVPDDTSFCQDLVHRT